MSTRFPVGTPALVASAFSAFLLLGCNAGEQASGPHDHAPVPDRVDAPAPAVSLAEPLVPTEAQVKAMEAVTQKPRLVLPAGPAAPEALAKASAADIKVGFDDPNSLGQITTQLRAWNSFANSYFQWVTPTVYAVVVPMNDNHYHLGYQNPNMCFSGSNGFVSVGSYGVKSGTRCIENGPANLQPRTLSPHTSLSKVQFYLYDRSRIYTFDLKGFYLPPTSDPSYGHVQVWIYKVGIGWRFWQDLASGPNGVTYTVPQDGIAGGAAINEIQIMSPNPNGAHGWTIDNIMIANVR